MLTVLLGHSAFGCFRLFVVALALVCGFAFVMAEEASAKPRITTALGITSLGETDIEFIIGACDTVRLGVRARFRLEAKLKSRGRVTARFRTVRRSGPKECVKVGRYVFLAQMADYYTDRIYFRVVNLWTSKAVARGKVRISGHG